MKIAILFLSLTVAATSNACKKDRDKSPKLKNGYIRLGECQDRIFNNETVKICYDKLLEDSRCPVGSQCFWQGQAIGEFSFHVNGNKHTLRLSTLYSAKRTPLLRYSKDTTIGNYKIELLDIDPYPGEDPAPPASASVSVTRL